MKKNFPILMLGLLPMLPTQALHAHSVSNKNTVATVNEAIILQMETNPSAAVKFSAAEELTTPSFLATASAEYATDSFKKKKIIIIKTEEDAKEYTDDDLEKAARKLEKFGNGKVKIERNPATEERIIVIEAPENENKTGNDTTIVKLGKMVLKVKPKGIEMASDSTFGKVKKTKAAKPIKNIKNCWFGLDLGLCNFVTQPDLNPGMHAGALPNKRFNLQQDKSYHIGLNIFEQRINLYNHQFNFRWGMGLSWEKFRFADNLRMYTDKNDGTLITAYDSINFSTNKFVARYVTLPAMLELKFGKAKTWKQASIAAGLMVSQYLGSWQTLKSSDRGSESKIQNGSNNLSQQKVSVIARVGLGKLNFYGSYSLTPMFTSKQQVNHYMPELNPFNFGIRLTGL
jgi:hypothetical protein